MTISAPAGAVSWAHWLGAPLGQSNRSEAQKGVSLALFYTIRSSTVRTTVVDSGSVVTVLDVQFSVQVVVGGVGGGVLPGPVVSPAFDVMPSGAVSRHTTTTAGSKRFI